MLRKTKIVFYSLITVVVLALFADFIREYDNNSIPENNTIINITSWNPKVIAKWQKQLTSKQYTKKVKKKTIFTKLKQVAQAENSSLVKLRINKFNGQQSKVVYNFGTPINDYSLYQAEAIKKLTNTELNLEEINGLYCTNAKNEALGQILSKFHTLGLKTEVIDNSLSVKSLGQIVVANFSKFDLIVLIGIIGTLFIVMVLEKVFRFKAYAIMKINGLSDWQIIKNDLKDESPMLIGALGVIMLAMIIWGLTTFTISGWRFFLPYALVLLSIVFLSFLVLNTISYVVLALIDPYQAIKGAETTYIFLLIGYVLKILLLALIMINTISLTNHNKIYIRDTNIINKWQRQKNTYSLELAWNPDNHREENKIGRMIHKLVVQSPGTIVAQNSQQFHPAMRDTEPENGNVIIANNNFIKNSKLNFNPTRLTANKVFLLIPYNRLDQVKQAKKQLRNFLKFQQTLPNYYQKQKKKLPPIQVVPIANGQNIFNYTVGYEITSSLSMNPLIIVVNNKLLSDNFYLASISQKLVQFSNFRQLENLIKHLGIKSYTIGITSQKARIAEYQRNANRQLLILTITTMLSLLQLIFIIVFVSTTFLQSQRRKIAIYRVFGRSNAHLMGSFLLTNLGLDFLVIALSLTRLHYLSLMPVVYVYLLLEAGVILLTYWRAQHNLLITLNHGN
ncbi:hypothetical protein SAMN04487792_0876 [Lactobacillus bombicola]|uniref:Bacteriocin-associated integral membrane protein n=1 Tax=Lactobacillus bombicola TaxID=1505723 RepID=A0A1I1SDT6_9LACO|nr:hypothetical protein [Lactobacillus bombicola]SFD44627.1 hypothetical protein SAMN04487792_0876 [Lactobacillus bombicola]